MILQANDTNKICFYVIYAKTKKVDDYVFYFIEKLKAHVRRFIAVVNGEINEESKKKLENAVDELWFRENVGYDISAYKYGIEKIGFDQLKNYNEVILCNDTTFGPIYPFSEAFDEMAKRDVDFWGLTKHLQCPFNEYENEYGYMPEHIQSYFIVFRNSIISSQKFIDYWKGLPEITDRTTAIGKFETVYTKQLLDLGFSYDVYVNVEKFQNTELYNPTYSCIFDLVKNGRCPVIKKNLPTTTYELYNNLGIPNEISNLFEYVEKNELYDLSLVWQNLLSSNCQSDLLALMKLSFCALNFQTENYEEKGRNAFAIIIDKPEKIKSALSLLKNLPNNFDIYISCQEKERLSLENAFYGVEYRTVEESDFCELFNRYLCSYGVAGYLDLSGCYLHAKANPFTFDKFANTMIGSFAQNVNVINELTNNKCLAMLCPYDEQTLRKEVRTAKKRRIKKALKKLGLVAPTKNGGVIVANPKGFWLKPSAFGKIELTKDIPSFAYAVFAQANGYYSSYLTSQKVEETNKFVNAVVKKGYKLVKRKCVLVKIKDCLKQQGFKKTVHKILVKLKLAK